MAEWGIQTWDESGAVNNFGFVITNVMDYISMSANTDSWTRSYTLPASTVLEVAYVATENDFSGNRKKKFTISGGTVTMTTVSEVNITGYMFPANSGYIIIYAKGI